MDGICDNMLTNEMTVYLNMFSAFMIDIILRNFG